MSGQEDLLRQPFPRGVCADRLLRLLLANDGSTTRICEAILGSVEVAVHRQGVVEDAPDGVAALLGVGALLERVTSLHSEGAVAMDNLVLARLDSLPPTLRVSLEEGRVSIGKLLGGNLLRRQHLDLRSLLGSLLERLGRFGGGPPDHGASRLYLIEGESGLKMLVAETYRGLLAERFCGSSS